MTFENKRDGSNDVTLPPLVGGFMSKNNCKYSHYFTSVSNLLAFLYSLVPNIVIKYYLCSCEWYYGTYSGCFWGFMADYKAVAMGQVFPLG